LSALALAAAATAPAAPERAAGPACKAGMTTVAGVAARTFCGPAKATLHIAGKTLAFKGGSCERTSKYLSLQIGTVVLGQTKKKKPDYFGIDVGAYPGSTSKAATEDGTYIGAVIAIDYNGTGYLLRGDTAKITLAGGRTRGSFTASVLLGSGTGSGTFSC
jgi:hypothetical protein